MQLAGGVVLVRSELLIGLTKKSCWFAVPDLYILWIQTMLLN